MNKQALILSAVLLSLTLLRCTDPGSSSGPPVPTVGSTSNGFYNVYAPYGGATVSVGTKTDIRWVSTGSVTDQYVQISLYSGDTLIRTISSSARDTGHYVWYPSANSSGTQYHIKIASSSDPSKFDFGAYFTLNSQYSGTVKVTLPASGTSVAIGASLTIAWTTTGSIGGSVKLELYNDTTFVSTITSMTSFSSQSGSYPWSYVSSSAGTGSKYRVKVSSYYDNGIYAFSPYFSISSQYSGTYTFTNPTDSSTFSAGSAYTVTWTSTGNLGTYVRIDLYRDSVLYITLTSSSSNSSNSYYWSTSSAYPTSSRYRLKISCYSDPGIYSFSDYFSIAGITPDQYEPDNVRSAASTITLGTVQNHTLSYNDTDWVQFKADSGTQYLLRNTGATATTTYLFYGDSTSYSVYFSSTSYSSPGFLKWACTKKGEYRARITSYYYGYSGSYSFGVSMYDSTTVASFIAPDSQTVWSAGSSYSIRWTPDTGLFGTTIKLGLFNPVSKTTTSITTYATNNGTYSWSIPQGLATLSTYRLVMTSYSNSGIYGYGPAFTISGVLPDSFEVDDSLKAASAIAVDGTVQNRSLPSNDIDWVSFPAVKDSLYVIRSAGTIQRYLYIYASKDSTNYSTYQSGTNMIVFWKATVTGTAYMKISASSSSYYGPYTLSVKKTDPSTLVTFLNPTSNSTWSMGSSYSISWLPDTGLFGPSVSLALCLDQKQVESITTSVTNGGTYTWVVPNGIASSNLYRIKMSGYYSGYSAAYAFSAPFTVSGIVPDTFETDDTISLSKPIATDGTPQARNLTRQDIDWINFAAQPDHVYAIEIACSLSTTLKLYNTDGVGVLQTSNGIANGAHAKIVWFCPIAGKYFLSVASTQVGSYQATVTAYDSASYRFSVSAPATNASFVAGSTVAVTWSETVNVGGFVDIFLYNNAGVVQTVAANAPNNGQYSWNSDAATVPGSAYYVKIISRYNSNILGYSGIFTITAP